MQSKASTPKEYIAELPDDRKKILTELRNVITKNLPKGFKEVMNYGMIGYVIPHSLYPSGYHCDPKQPLPFMGIASQKNFIAVYHMCAYGDKDLSNWFREEYSKISKPKLDMGKSCIRFKKLDQVPFGLIGKLASKVTPQRWIEIYETRIKR